MSCKVRKQYLYGEIWVFGVSFVLHTTNFGYKTYYVAFNSGYIGEYFGYFFFRYIGISLYVVN